MVINKVINLGLIKHNKPKANAQLLIINGLIISDVVKDSRFNLTRFN